MEQKKGNPNKKNLIIILGIIAAIVVFFVARAIYVNAVVDHAYDKATKEYNKAYEKAKRDADQMMKQYRY